VGDRVRQGALVALALLAVLSCARRSLGAPGDRGHIELSVSGHAGPLQLQRGDGGWSGRFRVHNAGQGSLRVLRVAVLDDAADVRSPPGLSARLADPSPLAPGETRDVLVSWANLGRVKRAFAQVVVTSSDEERGEVAMGVVASAPPTLGWPGRHALSLLVVWPFALVVVAALFGAAGAGASRWLRRAAVAVLGAEWLLALWVYREFVPGFGRADGNDGYQLVERVVMSAPAGVEWYVGVDSTSVLLVVLAATLGLVTAASADEAGAPAYVALALLVSGAVGAFVALDLVVLFVEWQVASLAVVLMASEYGASRIGSARLPAMRVGVFGTLGFLAMLAAFGVLARAAGPSFLVDGSHAAHTLSVPELARTSFDAAAPIARLPFVDVVWALLLVAVVFAPAATPLRGLLPDALDDAPAPAAALLGAVTITLGPYLLVRIAFPNLPGAARWAAPAVVALGAFELIQAAERAVSRRDARGAVSQAMIALAGACLCALGASRWR
jgi:NADH:ubiquinone oxidoreductase subunit 2 (subunit N)